MGDVDRLKTRITPGDAKIYAMMPYTVEAVNARVETGSCRRGDTVSYEVRLDTSAGKTMGVHCIRLDVTDPRGRAVGHYARNILLDGPRATGKLSLALNDPVGDWRLRFTDVVSGRSSVRKVQVKE